MRDKVNIRKITTLALFLAFALVAGIAERYIPISFSVPGVRLGLANVVVLAALYLFAFTDALTLVLLKCVLSVFIAGSFTSFVYSLSGSLLSLLVMALLLRVVGGTASPVGISVIGAVFHNIGQLIAAAAVMRTVTVFAYLPMLMVSGVLTGVIIGVLVKYVLRIVGRLNAGKPAD
ncbi:MAG: Gx transporter family protein [Oscillospiraceae bacterium]|nr:Gx transporter family protein [Oscillospiraceae bacterium]